ncbi:hypothetical protein RhiXN_05101 [Rhizoctonia solani]|uniref:Uncharacterized protein n=1 Tax=Rhizoctonia solani TaxID=456999 RepID=A0A8H8STH8_9AGAM|nr:uncharacterized protein RhiXN_05101 [Rhizoctonia solani]QRW17099.1 hypothetical protein RhiXN_05101 [Rhizoctonia solani]
MSSSGLAVRIGIEILGTRTGTRPELKMYAYRCAHTDVRMSMAEGMFKNSVGLGLLIEGKRMDIARRRRRNAEEAHSDLLALDMSALCAGVD